LAQYFADEMLTRSNNGLSVGDVDSFVVDSLEEWRSDGWLGTDVAGLETSLLNATTADLTSNARPFGSTPRDTKYSRVVAERWHGLCTVRARYPMPCAILDSRDSCVADSAIA
jgi:hypothetical protein